MTSPSLSCSETRSSSQPCFATTKPLFLTATRFLAPSLSVNTSRIYPGERELFLTRYRSWQDKKQAAVEEGRKMKMAKFDPTGKQKSFNGNDAKPQVAIEAVLSMSGNSMNDWATPFRGDRTE